MEVIKKEKFLLSMVVIIAILFIQQFASKMGGSFASLFNYRILDKEGVFVWISVHHIVQMIIGLVAIMVLRKGLKIEFYFHRGNVKTGVKYTTIFTFIILIYVLLIYAVGSYFNIITPYNYSLTINNVMGNLGFQMLLSGPSEEILFRALPIPLFIYVFEKNKYTKLSKWEIPLVILVSSLLFSIAHITWSISSFIMNIDIFQLIYAFILGIAYAITYIRSKSIIYPMVMHSISNVLMVGIGYIFTIL